MKMRNLILSGVLSLGILGSMGTNAFAAGGTAVNIETRATTVNMTVPSTMAVVFNEDGTNTMPTNFTVTNNSKIAGVSLTKIDVNAGSSGWNFCNADQDLKVKPAGTKDIKFTAGKEGVTKLVSPATAKDVKASATFTPGQISIPATGSQVLKFEMERTAFKEAIPSAKAFDMTLTFDFN